jgi:hypothetical protein
MTIRRLARSHRSIDKVRCECGTEILILPDVTAMSKAIDAHVIVHIQKLKASARTTAETERIRDNLIAQVFSKASQSENSEK